jgi:hypothetical protein
MAQLPLDSALTDGALVLLCTGIGRSGLWHACQGQFYFEVLARVTTGCTDPKQSWTL